MLITSTLSRYAPVNHESGMPANQQLMLKLEALLREKSVTDGDKFPSMRQIAEHFNVSQVTAQQVVNELALKNYIVKKHGIGSYVCDNIKLPPRIPCMRVSIPVFHPDKSDFSQPMSNMLAGAVVGLSKHGFFVNMVDCRKDGSEFLEICNLFRNGLSDGLILLGSLPNLKENFRDAVNISMPVLLLNRPFPGIPGIVADIEKTVMHMTEGLVCRGKKKICIYTIESDSPRFREIIAGVSKTLSIHGEKLEDSMIKFFPDKDICVEKAVQTMKQHIRKEGVPDAVFASPEILAIACGNALSEMNNIGTALISVGNPSDSYCISESRPVFRISVPYFEQGLKAGELMADCIKKGITPRNEIIKIMCKTIAGEKI